MKMTKSEADALAAQIAVIEVRLRCVQFVEGVKARRSGGGEARNPWRQCKNARWWMEGFEAPDRNFGEEMFDSIPPGEWPDINRLDGDECKTMLKNRLGASEAELKTILAIRKTNW